MKKTIKYLLALSIFLTVGSVALANEQQLDGRDEGFIPEAEIEVNARLGSFDNTVPGPYPPVGDSRWINVALPTAVLFQSADLDGGNVEDLVSATYQIRNYSHMGVAVTLEDFENVTNPASVAYIGELELVAGSVRRLLIDNGDIDVDTGLLANMPGSIIVTEDEGELVIAPSIENFSFEGLLSTIPEVGIEQPTFEMIFTFESINRDGTPVAEVE